jgi:GH15 family glucan-1,4-alpha-glucosidase
MDAPNVIDHHRERRPRLAGRGSTQRRLELVGGTGLEAALPAQRRQPEPDPSGVGAGRRTSLRDRPASIAQYGFLSDCRSAALVARNGSIDWLCWPRFDSPSVFAGVLDPDRGGTFAITPAGPYSVKRRYAPRTNVLQTTFHTATGVVRLHDWLHIGARQALCRIVECLEGSVELTLVCDPHPDYGAVERPRWERRLDYLVLPVGDGDRLILDGLSSSRETITLTGGEARGISLGWNRPGPSDLFAALKRAIRFWHDWTADLVLPDGISGDVAAHVERAALTLKGLQYQPSGAFVAAPTTSLPETIGGERNWDYRYSWLRDSAFTLFALRALGKTEEAQSWLDWIDAIAFDQGRHDLQIMYAIDGSADVPEVELAHLAGHFESRPVRIGNGAAKQRQLDVPGALADAIWLARLDANRPLPRHRWNLIECLADRTAAEWRLPDEGIWEVRGKAQHFVYSKVMCWVTLDRALRLARVDDRIGAPTRLWRATRDAIKAEILEQGYDARLGAFTQAYRSGTLDGATLLLAQVGFISARDPRFVSTVRAVERHLCRDGQVFRYRAELTDDGFASGEGTFTMCTFWLCLALHQIGAREEALALFHRALDRANDLGLLSEQLSVEGQQLGNFPQAFTHIAIIACATAFSRASIGHKTLRLAA